jgi:RHS repeat-associated protein
MSPGHPKMRRILPLAHPFGMNQEGAWGAPTNTTENRYQYNGKELNTDFGLNLNDYGARWYDSVLARWTSVDPLAEQYYAWNAYNYVMGRPLMFVDPTGMGAETDFLNIENGQTLHVEDGENQIALVNTEQFNQVQCLASMDSWNQEQSQQYQDLANSNVQGMDSDLGMLSRLTYAEMAQGNDNAKAIVAESAVNRTERPLGSYENPDGTLTSAINKKGAYDVTSANSIRHDEFLAPRSATELVKIRDKQGNVVRTETRSSYNQSSWLSSITASYNALNGSNVGMGTIFYHSGSSTFRDNNTGYEKVKLNIDHKGILGTWKIK